MGSAPASYEPGATNGEPSATNSATSVVAALWINEPCGHYFHNPKPLTAMRHALLAAALFLFSATYAQEEYQKILRTNPYLSNGYFIVNAEEWDQMDISHIDVDVIIATSKGNGVERTVVQSITIVNPSFGKADLGFVSTLEGDQYAYYNLRAYDQSGNVPVQYSTDRNCPDCWGWPAVCQQICNAPSYAWALKAFAGDGQGNITMLNAVTPNQSYFYFYVKQANWGAFMNRSQSAYGIPGSGWIDALHYPDEVFHVSSTTSEMRDEEGYSLGTGDLGAFAIAKHFGPWQLAPHGVTTSNMPIDINSLCMPIGISGADDNLRALFNANSASSNLLTSTGAPELVCNGMISLGGDANQWGGQFSQCTELTVYSDTYPDGTVDILGWMMELTDCAISPTNATIYPFSEVSSVEVIPITGGGIGSGGYVDPVISVAMPESKDPKLVQVPKTELSPGLYAFTVVMRNGDVLRHYEDFDQPVVINSHFAAFATINIYPVPIKGREFAVEFNLAYPLQVEMTILDNMGHTYFSKALNFETAGLNKIVVDMGQQWPGGIYHAIFQYQDGSSNSKNFTVME